MVLAAGRRASPEAHESLAQLCQTYWFPLYAYVRRKGYSPDDACDLTQTFFARLLEKNWLTSADRTKGRFRAFLLTAMKHFLADEWDRERAEKRGGGRALLPLTLDTAEARYAKEPADLETPDRIFERRWALTLLDEVLARVRSEYARDGRASLFEALHPCLVGERTAQPYAELASTLGSTEGAVKSAVHRLRARYRQALREEIASTLDDAARVDEELRHLLAVLSV
jgi:RNA polymerase sigma-70 factor (ECF subfamily)